MAEVTSLSDTVSYIELDLPSASDIIRSQEEDNTTYMSLNFEAIEFLHNLVSGDFEVHVSRKDSIEPSPTTRRPLWKRLMCCCEPNS